MTLQPLSVLIPSNDIRTVLVVLNRPLNADVNVLKKLWHKSVLRVCADGGSNRLHSILGGERDKYIPDLITGDLDSADSAVLAYYREKGAEVIITEDQDETDFTKSLRVTADKVKDLQFDYVAVLGAFGGRLDHVFANINTLYLAHSFMSQPVLLLSEGSLACLLNKGQHTVEVNTGLEANWCGLIPVGGTCGHVTTSGLKWNLDCQEMKFGDLISTSNTYSGSALVTIETDQPLVWTMGYKDPG